MARPRKTGAFYRFERGAVEPTGLEGIAITNGPALSPDGRILYFVDTSVRDDRLRRRRRRRNAREPEALRPDRPGRRLSRRAHGRQRRLRLDQPLCRLGGAPLLALRRAGGPGSIPGRQHHQDSLRRRRPAHRLRDHGPPASDPGADRASAGGRGPVRVPGRCARPAMPAGGLNSARRQLRSARPASSCAM